MSYLFYKGCFARNGHGAERAELLKNLREEESVRDHLIIRGMAGDKETEERMTVCRAQIAALEARLQVITHCPRAKETVS